MNEWNGQTQVLNVNREPACFQKAAKLLRSGEIVAFPTETVYGLGADATNDEAVQKIFAAKGRPADNPLIVHIADFDQLSSLVSDIPKLAQKCMDAFWPGPLTLILPIGTNVSRLVTAGLPTVGVRMPDHPVARQMLRAAALPVAAPSANLSGRPSPTRAQHVFEDLNGRIPLILDGGETAVGLESTVLDITISPPVILRPGDITRDMLQEAIGEVRLDPGLVGEEKAPRSPGMKYAHYAPKGDMTVIEGTQEHIRETIEQLCSNVFFMKPQAKIGVLLTTRHGLDDQLCSRLKQKGVALILRAQNQGDLREIGHDLYMWLREFDEHKIEYIFAEGISAEGFGMAVMNRMRKAAGNAILQV